MDFLEAAVDLPVKTLVVVAAAQAVQAREYNPDLTQVQVVLEELVQYQDHLWCMPVVVEVVVHLQTELPEVQAAAALEITLQDLEDLTQLITPEVVAAVLGITELVAAMAAPV
jgi:hypothetical protein